MYGKKNKPITNNIAQKYTTEKRNQIGMFFIVQIEFKDNGTCFIEMVYENKTIP